MAAVAASKTTSSKPFRRRHNASGSSNNPHVSGSIRHPPGVAIRADPETPVSISTVTFPVAPALTVVVGGLNWHTALAGSVPQL